jgi:hypothetical protein
MGGDHSIILNGTVKVRDGIGARFDFGNNILGHVNGFKDIGSFDYFDGNRRHDIDRCLVKILLSMELWKGEQQQFIYRKMHLCKTS